MEYYLDLENYVEFCDFPKENLILIDEISKRIKNYPIFYSLFETIGRIESEYLSDIFAKKLCYLFKYEQADFLYKKKSSIAKKLFEFIFSAISCNFYECKQSKNINNYPFYVIGNIVNMSVLSVSCLYTLFSDYFRFYETKPLKISHEFYTMIKDDIPPINYGNFINSENRVIEEIITNHFFNKNYFILFLRLLINFKKDLYIDNDLEKEDYISDNYVIENFIEDYYLIYSKINDTNILEILDKPWIKILCSK